MRQKECVAMILAGGNGTRLGTLTERIPKPMVHFGGRYRIIDFTLSNCAHSGIDTLGVLTQYRALELHRYIGDGKPWKLNRASGGTFMLPSNATGSPYAGTADAVIRNYMFIERFDPEHVLILSGDHVYKMDYGKMLAFHKETDADATIAAISVPWEEASRFGIINAAGDGAITGFDEKPMEPKSNLASMGIYIFKWSRLKRYLADDRNDIDSEHDFGKNIIPGILSSGGKLYAYRFGSYWRDVGAVQSLWESNMDLLAQPPGIDPRDGGWEIFANAGPSLSSCLSIRSDIRKSIISEGCGVYGKVENSVLCDRVNVGEGAEIVDSVLMPGANIGRNAKVYKAIIGDNVSVGENTVIGANDGLDNFLDDSICSNDISLIGPGVRIGANVKIQKSSYIGSGSIAQKRRAPDALPVAGKAAVEA